MFDTHIQAFDEGNDEGPLQGSFLHELDMLGPAHIARLLNIYFSICTPERNSPKLISRLFNFFDLFLR